MDSVSKKKYKVIDYLGMKYIPGQGDIEVNWKWLCKDLDKDTFVIVEEFKNWGYSSPELNKLEQNILEADSNSEYFNVKENEVNKCVGQSNTPEECSKCKDYNLCKSINFSQNEIAVVGLPVTSAMVRLGKFSIVKDCLGEYEPAKNDKKPQDKGNEDVPLKPGWRAFLMGFVGLIAWLLLFSIILVIFPFLVGVLSVFPIPIMGIILFGPAVVGFIWGYKKDVNHRREKQINEGKQLD